LYGSRAVHWVLRLKKSARGKFYEITPRRFWERRVYNAPVVLYVLGPMLNEKILDHFRNPHNAGNLASATAVAEVTNPVCGDTMRLSVRMQDGRVAEARFKTQGCVASIAAGSVLTDLLADQSLRDVRKITVQRISEELGGLPPGTMHAAELAMDALIALLNKIAEVEPSSAAKEPQD
jgi:nitrogen fixation protein NifU and related proteins